MVGPDSEHGLLGFRVCVSPLSSADSGKPSPWDGSGLAYDHPNLDSILESRDITLLAKVHIVKAMGFPGGTSGKEPAYQCKRHKRRRYNPWVGKIPWRRAWPPTPVCLPGEFHRQRNLADYSPWGGRESDVTEQLTFSLWANVLAVCDRLQSDCPILLKWIASASFLVLFPFPFFFHLWWFLWASKGWLGERETGAGWKEHVRLRGFTVSGC